MIVATSVQHKRKRKYSNWNVPTIVVELRKRGLCCLYKRGDKTKLVKRLKQDDAGIQAFQRLDPQTAISGLAGVPRPSTSGLEDETCLVAQSSDESGNDSIVNHMTTQFLNLRSGKRAIEQGSQNFENRTRTVALNLADGPRSSTSVLVDEICSGEQQLNTSGNGSIVPQMKPRCRNLRPRKRPVESVSRNDKKKFRSAGLNVPRSQAQSPGISRKERCCAASDAS